MPPARLQKLLSAAGIASRRAAETLIAEGRVSVNGHTVTELGTGLQATSGIFNLFSPTSDPTLKLMVYEMGFQHEGKNYYFAGQKNVRQDPIFDLWKATTTLYSQIH